MIRANMIRSGLTEQIADHYMQIISAFPEGAWIFATNKNDKHYDVFKHLSELNLVATMRVPQTLRGNVIGCDTYFMWGNEIDVAKWRTA